MRETGNVTRLEYLTVSSRCSGVDVGGAWCWKASHHEVPALATRFGIQAFDQYDNGLNVVDYGDSIMRCAWHNNPSTDKPRRQYSTYMYMVD